MVNSSQNLYISNMAPPVTSIQSYSLFGESTHLPDVLHCETIAERSVLHDWELAPHRHARLHQVLLILSGGGTAQLDDQSFALEANALVNVPPGHVHAFRFTQGTQGWVTTLADELLDEIFVRVGDVRQELGHACVLTATPAIQQTMALIWEEFSSQAKARALLLRGLSTTLLGWVARQMQGKTPKGQASAESLGVQRFKQLIEQHFLEHWRVADYARALAISPTHLSRLTRAATGESASRLIEARLLREARRNLAYTNLSISTIAYALGYTDPAYFSRVFTQDTGISPRKFRDAGMGVRS